MSAVVVILLLLLALLLYKYRYKRRVQIFLARFTPFKMAPYTQLEKKRSSIGQDLLYTDGRHGASLVTEKRISSVLTAPATRISPPFNATLPLSPPYNATQPLSPPFNATRPLSPPFNATRPLCPPFNATPPLCPPYNATRPLSPPFNTTRPLSPPFHATPPLALPTSTKPPTLTLPIQVSPPTSPLPQLPAPTATNPLHRRTSTDSLISTASSDVFSLSHLPTTHAAAARRVSQDSVTSNVSVASSGVFSPSMLSWGGMPPPLSTPASRAASTAASSPPPTRGAFVQGGLEGLAARYKPLTPTRVEPALAGMAVSSQPGFPGMPVPPARVAGGDKGGVWLG